MRPLLLALLGPVTALHMLLARVRVTSTKRQPVVFRRKRSRAIRAAHCGLGEPRPVVYAPIPSSWASWHQPNALQHAQQQPQRLAELYHELQRLRGHRRLTNRVAKRALSTALLIIQALLRPNWYVIGDGRQAVGRLARRRAAAARLRGLRTERPVRVVSMAHRSTRPRWSRVVCA